jgi:hypothetical protein
MAKNGRTGDTTAPAGNGGFAEGGRQTTGKQGNSCERTRRKRLKKADERRERVGSERSETFRELQRIIKDSGIGLVREEAFERNEFRDMLEKWNMQLNSKGVNQERDGLPFGTGARIAFNLDTEQGGAGCKHDVEYWRTEDPLSDAYKVALTTVIAQRDALRSNRACGDTESYADLGTFPAPHTAHLNQRRCTRTKFGVD